LLLANPFIYPASYPKPFPKRYTFIFDFRGKPMKTYNRIVSTNIERVAALSDGIFAVAMTLLVLDLRVPVLEVIHTSQPLWTSGAVQSEQVLADVLVKLAPRLLTYFMSFLTLGIFWVGQQTQLNHFERTNRDLTWIHLIFLFAVSIMPFSTGLLAEYITFRLALVIYWLNLLTLGVVLYFSWRYAERNQMLKPDVTPEIGVLHKRRVITYQALYAFGALLCVFNTYVSIAFIVLLELNSVIAPRIWPLDRF
jgi:uncharacterized membrane protein